MCRLILIAMVTVLECDDEKKNNSSRDLSPLLSLSSLSSLSPSLLHSLLPPHSNHLLSPPPSLPPPLFPTSLLPCNSLTWKVSMTLLATDDIFDVTLATPSLNWERSAPSPSKNNHRHKHTYESQTLSKIIELHTQICKCTWPPAI